MGWDRQKASVAAKPETPSLVLWLTSGLIAVISGMLLFVLHANQLLALFQKFNLWIVSGSPIFIWFIMISFRSWRYNLAMDRYQFESDEANYAKLQWTSWAGRYLAVMYSRVILPKELTPSIFLRAPPDLEQSGGLSLRVSLPDNESVFSALLQGLDAQVLQSLSDLPLSVTLLTDSTAPDESLQCAFSSCWLRLVGQTCSLPSMKVLKISSFDWVNERLKSPTLDVELLMVHQLQGGGEYSDALSVILLTSDDVATKYQLSHHARLLRPMSFDAMGDMNEGMDTFFSTQSQAIAVSAIIGDYMSWGDEFSSLLASAKKYEGSWKPQQCHWLEKYAGLSGPFSPWVLATVASDITALTKKDCLMLSSDKARRYMNTVTKGNSMNGEG
ncbi:TPA: hypothetical protein JD264_11290 [Serratia fonticola]|nr:hypothetical protein [Serratia fonticola]